MRDEDECDYMNCRRRRRRHLLRTPRERAHLLLISGGGGDAGNYSDLAGSLAPTHAPCSTPTTLAPRQCLEAAVARSLGSISPPVPRTPSSCWWLTSRRSSAFWTTPIGGLPCF